jgi:hypothetical protein
MRVQVLFLCASLFRLRLSDRAATGDTALEPENSIDDRPGETFSLAGPLDPARTAQYPHTNIQGMRRMRQVSS